MMLAAAQSEAAGSALSDLISATFPWLAGHKVKQEEMFQKAMKKWTSMGPLEFVVPGTKHLQQKVKKMVVPDGFMDKLKERGKRGVLR